MATQRDYITKDKSSSPTVSLYALMGSCVMDTLNDRKVITVDIPGAFLQGEWPQDEHQGYIVFKGITVEMIYEIDPSYHKNVIESKDCKKKFLYGRQDYKKLGKVISYLKETVHLPLVVGADDSDRLTWNIDASFTV